jgi:hypothetical protein
LKATFDSRDRCNVNTAMEEFQIQKKKVALSQSTIRKYEIQTILTGTTNREKCLYPTRGCSNFSLFNTRGMLVQYCRRIVLTDRFI